MLPTSHYIMKDHHPITPIGQNILLVTNVTDPLQNWVDCIGQRDMVSDFISINVLVVGLILSSRASGNAVLHVSMGSAWMHLVVFIGRPGHSGQADLRNTGPYPSQPRHGP